MVEDKGNEAQLVSFLCANMEVGSHCSGRKEQLEHMRGRFSRWHERASLRRAFAFSHGTAERSAGLQPAALPGCEW